MKGPWNPSLSLNLLLVKFFFLFPSLSYIYGHQREKREVSSEIGLARRKVKIYTYCMSALWQVNYYFAHIALW